jgi:Domain of unknown function (DUF6531)
MKNAIERRIDRLAELCNGALADAAIRLICWRCDLDERRMLGIFVELEAQDVAQTVGTFIKLAAPFTAPHDYADALVREIEAQYEASRDGLRQQGLFDGWRVPERQPDDPSGQYLLRAVDTLREAYADRMQLLVLVLAPDAIADGRAWRYWLERLALAQIPPLLRIMVIDPIEAPLLEGLDEASPGCVVTIEPSLDMPAALDELARSEGQDGPAKTFRIHLVTLSNAASKGNAKAAERAASRALAVAREQGWPDQEVVVHMALGASRLAASRCDPAATSYRDALLAARRAGEAKHPAAGKLELAAGMGLGGALLAGTEWAQAAKVYEACVPLATVVGDNIMTLEGWRMAAHCHEQAGADTEAWRCTLQAIAAGEALPEEQRRTSSLLWVGGGLLRLLDRHYDDQRDAVELRVRLDALLGGGWGAFAGEGARCRMMPAATHFDPVVGVDIHIIQPPGPVPPVPIPHPYVGMVIDYADYAPIIGSTIKVNGLHRAIAGTSGKAIPKHIPIGGMFVPPLPASEHEDFMGSATVEFDGDAATYMALPCLSCQSIGMPPIPRLNPKKGTKLTTLVLPTTVVLPIPKGPPVLIGGPPTISLMSVAMHFVGPLAKALGKTKAGKAIGRLAAKGQEAAGKLWKKALSSMPPGFIKCKILRAEPVNVVTGEVVVDQQDFELPGRIPIRWTRHYQSGSERPGTCGMGWETPADARLEVGPERDVIFHDGRGVGAYFERLPDHRPVMELVNGATLHRMEDHFAVRLKGGLTYYFPARGPRPRPNEILVSAIIDLCHNSLHFIRDEHGLKEVVESAGRRLEVNSRGGGSRTRRR